MSVSTKIKKVMSDGWTIIETYVPGKGLSNEYYYQGEKAPSVRMTDKISRQYAAYTLIEKDLRSVIFWLEEIERLSPDPIDRVKDPAKMNMVKGLFVAALTFYGKCFSSCEGRGIKLERGNISEEFQDAHDHVMKLRHNFAAHSGAENLEEVKVSLALHPSKKSDMKPQLYTELFQPDYVSGESLAFKALAEHLRGVTFSKRSRVGEVVLEKIVAPKGKRYWYTKAKTKK